MTIKYLSPDRETDSLVAWKSSAIQCAVLHDWKRVCYICYIYLLYMFFIYFFLYIFVIYVIYICKTSNIFDMGFLVTSLPCFFFHSQQKKNCIWSKTSNSYGPTTSLPELSIQGTLNSDRIPLWLLKTFVLQIKALMKSLIITEVHRLSSKYCDCALSGPRGSEIIFGLQSFPREHPEHWDCTREGLTGKGFPEHHHFSSFQSKY